ncbi:MAG TPA: MotA/TolQ/ExbB proton channel family protein [Phycisphaerales bacterium]|nr:MotA/TolQ/ExbB proton channel family protein [Phycisphaerales bacterium]
MAVGSSLLFVLAQAATPAAPAAPTVAAKSLWDYVMDGGLLGFVLIGLSVFALTLMIRNALAIREERLAPGEVLDAIEEKFREGKFREVEKMCKADDAPYAARIVGKALSRCLNSPYGMMEFRTAVEDAAGDETDRLHRMNDWIGILAAIGPMLGLLGTVIGMIGAFSTIGRMTGAQRSNELATFMSMALVNTAQGLVVAIPCTVAFAIFRRRIDAIVSKVGQRLERINSVAQSKPAPAAAKKPAEVA